MVNLKKEKTKMTMQDPKIRNSNFQEVGLGYTLEEAVEEAKRCLNCPTKPCMDGCPVNVRIPNFIQCLVNGDVDQALEEIKVTNNFPSICGRVCPQEKQCEKLCIRGIKGESVAIGNLERFVGDTGVASLISPQLNGIKVAVVGSGPAGLSCARDCAIEGFEVTIFEALHEFGGVLSYGIPEFRLPKSIVQREMNTLKEIGVQFEKNQIIGRLKSLQDLKHEGYQAIFIGTGAGLPRFMNIPHENAVGVVSANEYLTRCNLMKAYSSEFDTPIMKAQHTVVVGGGNVAMDAARCAKRLGGEVTLVYRRSLDEMPARKEEIEHAMEEGVNFRFLTNPINIIPDNQGRVSQITCIQMKKIESDSNGRQGVVEIEGSDFIIDCDCVIMAIGTIPNPLLKQTETELKTNKWGCLIVDGNQETSIPQVYAGGDVVSGAATVILAMEAGKKAARSIKEYLTKPM